MTGESVPVSKIPLPLDKNEMLSFDAHKRHILFGGTEVMQVNGNSFNDAAAKALVLRTGELLKMYSS